HGDHRQGFPVPTGDVIRADVDSGLPDRSPHPADDAWNVPVPEHDDVALRDQIDPELADSNYPSDPVAEDRAGHAGVALSGAHRDPEGGAEARLRAPDPPDHGDPPRFREGPGVDHAHGRDPHRGERPLDHRERGWARGVL